MEHWFSLKGRINRARYFCYSALVWLAWFALQVSVEMMTDAGQHPEVLSSDTGSIIWLLFCVIFTQLIVLQVRRLHDLNRSGWQFWLGLIPLYGLYQTVILLFEKGTDGPNRYGEDPLRMAHMSNSSQVFTPTVDSH